MGHRKFLVNGNNVFFSLFSFYFLSVWWIKLNLIYSIKTSVLIWYSHNLHKSRVTARKRHNQYAWIPRDSLAKIMWKSICLYTAFGATFFRMDLSALHSGCFCGTFFFAHLSCSDLLNIKLIWCSTHKSICRPLSQHRHTHTHKPKMAFVTSIKPADSEMQIRLCSFLCVRSLFAAHSWIHSQLSI